MLYTCDSLQAALRTSFNPLCPWQHICIWVKAPSSDVACSNQEKTKHVFMEVLAELDFHRCYISIRYSVATNFTWSKNLQIIIILRFLLIFLKICIFSMFYCPAWWYDITEHICKDFWRRNWTTSDFSLICTGFVNHKNPLARCII